MRKTTVEFVFLL